MTLTKTKTRKDSKFARTLATFYANHLTKLARTRGARGVYELTAVGLDSGMSEEQVRIGLAVLEARKGL